MVSQHSAVDSCESEDVAIHCREGRSGLSVVRRQLQTSVGMVETVGLAKIVEEPCKCFAESDFELFLRYYALYIFKFIKGAIEPDAKQPVMPLLSA